MHLDHVENLQYHYLKQFSEKGIPNIQQKIKIIYSDDNEINKHNISMESTIPNYLIQFK